METAPNHEIVQLLTPFYDDGRVPCAGAPPLRIARDPRSAEVRLRGDGPSAYVVVFPEASFVEMVQRSGMPPTETLIRVWLSTLYFNPHVYAWAQCIALSETNAHHNAAVRR